MSEMNFQIIKDDYYERLLQRLKMYAPEFTSAFDDEYGVYPILGEYASYVVDNIDNRNVITKAANFIDEALDQGGSDTENAIVLQLFQKFYEATNYSIELFLSEYSLEIFNKYKSF